MGQGGHITFVNGTRYDWRNTEQHSYQMDWWGFPAIIPAGTTATVYIEFSQGIFETWSDDSGVLAYTLGDTGMSFQLHATGGGGFNLRVILTNIATVGHPQGSTINLGWNHNGFVNFILTGEPGKFISSQPPSAWMQENLDILGNRPLRHLCIPGSHDAGMGIFGSASTAFGFRCNTITQTQSILGQLNCGSRYFDIRPVISGGQFHTGHYGDTPLGWQGANGQSIASVIDDVNAFTAANRELVVLYLSNDRNTDLDYSPLNQNDWNVLLSQLQRLNHRFVASNPTSVDLTMLRLKDFISGRPAVIVIVDPGNPAIQLGSFATEGFYTKASFPRIDEYSNTNDLAFMASNQLSKLRDHRSNPNDKYFLLSWTLTQNDTQASTCFLHTADSILDLATRANPALYRDLLPECNGRTYPNVLYIDKVESSDIAALALAVNSTAIQYVEHSWFRIGNATNFTVPPKSAVSAVARQPEQMDLFVVGHDGGVYSTWWNPFGWETHHNWFRIGHATNFTVPSESVVSVIARQAEQLDLFVVGHDGGIYTQWWNPSDGWDNHAWQRVDHAINFTVPPKSVVTALARRPEQIDLFVVGHDGGVYTTHWHPMVGWETNHNWGRIGGSRFTAPQGSVVSALARQPEQIDLFLVGHDGGIYSTWWNPAAGWEGQGGFRVGRDNFTVPPKSVVTAIARRPDYIDLFVVGHDGGIYTQWWNPWDGWDNHNWTRIGGAIDFTVPAGSIVSAVARQPDQIDLFVTGHDGGIYSTYWHPAGGWELNHNWFRVGVASNFTVPSKSIVSALARKPEQMDLFVVGHGGEVFSTWWNPRDGWGR